MQSYLSKLDAIREVMVHRVIEWSNINSGSNNLQGLNQIAASITEAFSSLQCHQEQISLPSQEIVDEAGNIQQFQPGPLLRFWKRPEAKTQVLLVGHMDTVYGSNHPFQKAVRITEDIIEGPGVADMKGGLCVLLEALKIFEETPNADQLGWEVLINSDEEIGSLGSAPFIDACAKKHQLAFVYEPAMDEKGTLAGERKGSGNFTIIVRGKSAHAGRDFKLGRNAIVQLSDMVTKIHALNDKKRGVTFNIGQIQGGTVVNMVPDLAICKMNVRIQDVSEEEWVLDELNAIIEAINKLEVYHSELRGKFTRKPKLLNKNTQNLYNFVAEVGQEINQKITWQASGGCSDGNNLSAAGLPNVDTLGVCGGKLHSTGEYLLIDSLIERAKLTVALLVRLNENKLEFLNSQ